MAKAKRVPVTMAEEAYRKLKQEADLAQQSMNQYIQAVLNKRRVVIFPEIHKLYAEIYSIRVRLEQLDLSDGVAIRELIERCDRMCRSCDTLLVDLTKHLR